MTTLKEYLEWEVAVCRGHLRTSQRYTSPRDYVLQHGKLYESQPLTEDERAYLAAVLKAHGTRFPIKQCYYNSQLLVATTGALMQDERYTLHYVEGVASAIIPIDHAWVSLNGKVVDVTLRYHGKNKGIGDPLLPGRAVGEFLPDRQYYGVEFRAEAVRRHAAETKYWGPLIDDWRLGYPLLQDGGGQTAGV